MLAEGLLANARTVGADLLRLLHAEAKHAPAITDVRGLGLMIGVELHSKAAAATLAWRCYEQGLLVLECGEKAIRLSPPLIMTADRAATTARILLANAASL